MKILIKNFGPIHEFEFDLEKDLHVIYGENSIGKSYISYVVYLLLKNLKNPVYDFCNVENYNETELFVDNIIQSKPKKVNITKDVEIIMQKELQKSLVPNLVNSLSNTFDSLNHLKNEYSKQDFQIIVRRNSVEYQLRFVNNQLLVEYLKFIDDTTYEIVQRKTKDMQYALHKFGRKLENRDDSIVHTLYRFGKKFENRDDSIVNAVFTEISNITSRNIGSSSLGLLRELHFLPSSRSGLHIGLSAFTPILAELSQNRFFLTKKTISLPTLSEPIADYYRDLATIDTNNQNEKMAKIIAKIEKTILNGMITYNTKTSAIEYTNSQTSIQVDIEKASSMISELAPLLLFLKHIVDFKNPQYVSRFFKMDFRFYSILFIEEPEAHLHPKIQVQLMEIFAELTKVGVKVVMTTHSNYMFNKLSNMLLKKEIEVDKVGSYHLVMTDKGSVVNPDMQATEEGMEDHNFVDTAEELYNERLLAYETLNAITH